MRIQDLVASDFPGIDQKKFDEWKALQIRANRAPWIGLATMVGVGIVSVPLIGGGIGWLLPLIAYFAAMSPAVARGKRLRELTRELGMREKLKAKRRGKTSSV
jgi:hypothetical protein